MARSQFLPAAIAVACYAAEAPKPAIHSSASLASLIDVPSLGAARAPDAAAGTPRLKSGALVAAAPGSQQLASATLGASSPVRSLCAPEMAEVQRPEGTYCIDRWEGSLVDRAGAPWPNNQSLDKPDAPAGDLIAVSAPGRLPQGYISGAQAARACRNAGKRLCELDEWAHACRGSHGYQHPYGNERRVGACNEPPRRSAGHPVMMLFDRFAKPGTDRATMWNSEWMNDPRLHEMPFGLEPTGSRTECKSEAGVYDMVGNLHEWIADPEGTFVGGFFLDTTLNGEGCAYRTRAHDFDYHDYSTGFRCCADVSEGASAAWAQRR
ncbi:MAG TPA: SUMF1/EgtB/PvdO family nonheme iron enzyme [Polyangiaceae bacterium]|nr:SUMF1/EgtB/PvdO family nonheme iron enzyme [Polyangiaceae bacterium]